MSKKLEKNVEQLLCFMKSKLDKLGRTCAMIYFNFEEGQLMHYINAPAEESPDGEEQAELKKTTGMNNEEITAALNFCVANGYIKPFINRTCVALSEKGVAYARSVERAEPNTLAKRLEQIVINVTSSGVYSVLETLIKKWIK